MKKHILTLFISCIALTLQAQNPVPAQAQTKRILLIGGTAHIGNGEVIANSAIGFEKGKLTLVADATTIRIDRAAYDTIISTEGKHVYPGLIGMNNIIGLSEIESVRATHDYAETGSYNPSVRSIIAYNTDSRITPTIRSNGVLLAQITPRGGVVSGQSSVVELDAWNYEDAAYKTDDGIHINWPSMRVTRSRRSDPDDKQKERTQKTLEEIRKLFSDAKAYYINPSAPLNQHLEAMKGLFDGSKKLYVHCNYVKEIIAAAGLCRDFGINMVLVGGTDAHMVTELLKQQKIPVVLMETHRLPSREDEDIDMPYRLPSLLEKAGIPYAIAVKDFWQVRNLPFQAGQAAGHGLTREQALKSVTLSAAKILGIDSTAGSLETGKDATLLITSGDLLDMKTSVVEQAFIRGKQIDLDNVQKQLNNKYNKKYGF
jgi:imidazolonepropionase-like amidohydrolase